MQLQHALQILLEMVLRANEGDKVVAPMVVTGRNEQLRKVLVDKE
jgi:hypothetical protein